MEPEQFVRELDEVWNSHGAEAALAYFADDAIVTLSPAPPPPLRESHAGRDELREFVGAVFRVSTSPRRTSHRPGSS